MAVSEVLIRLELERRRRDRRSAAFACIAFYGILAALSYRYTALVEQSSVHLMKVKMSNVDLTKMTMQEQAAPGRLAVAAKAKADKRQTVMTKLDRPEHPKSLQSKEYQPVQDAPDLWAEDRPELAADALDKPSAIELPDPIEAPQPVPADNKPVPIQKEIASVQQKDALAAKTIEVPRQPQKPEEAAVLPREAAAPNEVVRRKPESDFQPDVAARVEAVQAAAVGPIRRAVAKSENPVADIPAAAPSSAVPIDRASPAPVGWQQVRSGSVADRHDVRVNDIDLPVIPAAAGAGAPILAAAARPMEMAVSTVQPTSVGLARARLGTSSAPARPVSTSVVVPQVEEAPVEVVRRDAPKTLVFQSAKSADGLSAPRIRGAEKRRDKTAVAHRAPTLSEIVQSVPSVQDLPAAPAVAPDKWTDPSRQSMPALAERAQMAAPAASLPAAVRSSSGETFVVARAAFDVDIENISSEFEFLPLSEHTPSDRAPAGATASAAAASFGNDAVTTRNLIRSDLPELPAWYEKEGFSTVGIFRVHITPDGDVTSVDMERTTGYKEIDAQWMSAILNFKYEKGETGGTRLLKLRGKLKR